MHTIFEDNQAAKTLVLFHGTGGNEHDLLPLARQVAPGYNLLGLRGAVNENGLHRFFVRTALGVFDQESIRREAKVIHDFLTTWVAEHDFTFSDLIFLGFSNGANMILALAFLYPDLVHQAVVLHPMLPLVPSEQNQATKMLQNKSFLVSYGLSDPMVSPEESKKVVAILSQLGAVVEEVALPGGHQLSLTEVERIQAFLQR